MEYAQSNQRIIGANPIIFFPEMRNLLNETKLINIIERSEK